MVFCARLLQKDLYGIFPKLCLVILGMFAGGNLRAETTSSPKKISCTHVQVCNLLEEIFKENQVAPSINISLTTTIKGDPHLFDPGIEDIKTLLKVPYLVTPPYELQPWLEKIHHKRVSSPGLSAQTLHLSLPAPELEKYSQHKTIELSLEAVSHFWLYPDILCSLKKDLTEKLKKWHFDLKKISCDLTLENSLKELSSQFQNTWILLSHDAFSPLLQRWGFSVLSLKGSGHHNEVHPDQLKKIYQLLHLEKSDKKISRILWVLEKDLHHSSFMIKKQKRPQDLLIEIPTEGQIHEPPLEILRNFIQNLQKVVSDKTEQKPKFNTLTLPSKK